MVYEKIQYLMNFTNGKYKLNNISFYCLINLLKFNNTVRIAVIILKVSMMFLVVSSSNFLGQSYWYMKNPAVMFQEFFSLAFTLVKILFLNIMFLSKVRFYKTLFWKFR